MIGTILRRRSMVAISFLWGLAEATVFFIVPDVALGLIALFVPRLAAAAVGVALAGALLGGTISYAAGAAGLPVEAALLRVPLIDAPLIAQAAERLDRLGPAALLPEPLLWIPYKIYAALAGLRGMSPLVLLAVTVPARLVRFVPVALLFGTAGRWLRAPIQRRPVGATVLYLSLWVGIYFLYYVVIR